MVKQKNEVSICCDWDNGTRIRFVVGEKIRNLIFEHIEFKMPTGHSRILNKYMYIQVLSAERSRLET